MTLTVATDDLALVGEYTLLVEMTLTDYDKVIFSDVDIIVQNCIPLELVPPEGERPLSPL